MVDRRHHADGVRHSIAHPPHHRRLGLEPVIVIIEILSWRDQPLMLLLRASWSIITAPRGPRSHIALAVGLRRLDAARRNGRWPELPTSMYNWAA
jgi:hypothetical protein